MQHRSQHRGRIDLAIRFHGDQRGARQVAIGRIGYDANRRKGQLVPVGRPGCNVRFHIRRRSTGRGVQIPLGGSGVDRPVDTGDRGDHRARKRPSEIPRPGSIGFKRFASRKNAAGNDDSTRPQTWRHPARQAEAHDARDASQKRDLDRLRQTEAVATAYYHAYVGSSHNARLGAQADHKKRRFHMPHITDVALLAIRFRYRPSAHSGKYLAYP